MPVEDAQKVFLFRTQLSLVEITGLKARDLGEFVTHLRAVPESSVYYHTHHFLQQHQHLVPEPPNDFAYWVTNMLQEDEVGERIAAIDTVSFRSLETLREAIVKVIDAFLDREPALRQAPEGEEFHFMKCTLFNLATRYRASNLAEFLECLRSISTGCLYNHVFSARLRTPKGLNDFSDWLSTSLGEKALAARIQALDPYTQTLEGLRKKIMRLVEARLREPTRADAR